MKLSTGIQVLFWILCIVACILLLRQKERQVLVVKGHEGFADRLQVLSHAIHYCLQNESDICVDWRDSHWGQEETDFEDYFEIIDVPLVSLEEVVRRAKRGATIYPPAWTPKLLAAIPSPDIHKDELNAEIDDAYTRKEGDIVVFHGLGVRTWHLSNLTRNIRLHPKILGTVRGRLENMELPCTVVHLRGTDRLKEKTVGESLGLAVAEYESQARIDHIRTYVITDMKEMFELWAYMYPHTKMVYQTRPIGSMSKTEHGTHMMSKEELAKFALTKHELNVNAITDFFILSFASKTVGNCSESLFTNLAKFVKQSGTDKLAVWFHGWMPNTVPLNPNLLVKTHFSDREKLLERLGNRTSAV